MCFKCGAISHPGVSCNNVGNPELRAYIKSNKVRYCPKCGHGVEKIEGCNHMTCYKCNVEWCWVCGTRILGDHHFSGWNPFGCSGMQFAEQDSPFKVVLLKLLLIPIIVIFGHICDKGSPNGFCCLLYSFIFIPLVLAFTAIISVIFMLVGTGPVILMQTYRILKITLRNVDFLCCFRCLPCCK
jgi:hypothetical protein